MRSPHFALTAVLSLSLGPGLFVSGGLAADQPPQKAPGDSAPAATAPVPLNPEKTVLIDKTNKKLLVLSTVCLREGALEFLATIKGTKEHEAILAVDAKAYVIHTGLLALGAKTGRPAVYGDRPEDHSPPTGQEIEIVLVWTDSEGKTHRDPAQSWVRHLTRKFYLARDYVLPEGLTLPEKGNLRYDRKHKELSWYGPMTEAERDQLLKLSSDNTFRDHIRRFHKEGQSRPLEAKWVFPGSGFYTNPDTGKKFYLAEDGDLICVANFSSALLDVAISSSSQGNENLLFESWTDRVPPQGTPVTMELIPVFTPPAKPAVKAD